MRIAQEEVFGPVLAVIPFKDEDEAIAIGNDVVYGLAAGVWTQNMRRALMMAEKLQAGTVWINTYRAVSYLSPFGGYKRSGLGRESGQEMIKEYLQVKSVWISTATERAESVHSAIAGTAVAGQAANDNDQRRTQMSMEQPYSVLSVSGAWAGRWRRGCSMRGIPLVRLRHQRGRDEAAGRRAARQSAASAEDVASKAEVVLHEPADAADRAGGQSRRGRHPARLAAEDADRSVDHRAERGQGRGEGGGRARRRVGGFAGQRRRRAAPRRARWR